MEFLYARIKDFFRYGEKIDLKKSLSSPPKWNKFEFDHVTVFLSHKHEELDLVKKIIDFFQSNYNVSVYIDANDIDMPNCTCRETASRLRRKIRNCRKFIFMATQKSIESKWCNWELGQGDVLKYNKNLAIFPILLDDNEFSGNEYLRMYSYILPPDKEKFHGDHRVRSPKDGSEMSLRDWLNT